MKDWESQLINIVWTIDPHLLPEWRTDSGRGRVLGAYSRIFYDGRQLLFNEERKKGIRKYRSLLKKTLKYRNTFTVTCRTPEGPCTEKPLQSLFWGPNDESLPPGAIHVKGPADSLADMIAECDRILGPKEPARHPRRMVIRETLALWHQFTGKIPRRNAIQPNIHTGDRLDPPYEIARIVLKIIEDCSDVGDFSGMYETIVKAHFPTK